MNKLQQYSMILETVSPIHIASGDNLNTTQYLYNRAAGKVHFLYEQAWIKFLNERDLLGQFEVFIKNFNFKCSEQKNLYNWLIGNKITEKEMQVFISDSIDIGADAGVSCNEITTNISSVNDKQYIPGSSIKGALRTAILYHFIRKDKNLRERYWGKIKSLGYALKKDLEITTTNQEINRLKANFRKNIENLARELDKEILYKLDINTYANAIVNDSMRGLRVSDARLIDKNISMVLVKKIDVFHMGNTGETKENAVSIYRECFPLKTKLKFEITIDPLLLNKIGITDIKQILSMSSLFTKNSLQQLQKAFHQDFYEMQYNGYEQANVMLGGGAGFIGKSLLYALAPTEEEGREIVKKCFYNHEHESRDKIISPRTLKTCKINGVQYLMGLGSIKEK